MIRPAWASLVTLLLLWSFVKAQECSETVPCENGCCSKFGFCGFGKDYCSDDVCKNNCDAKAQCDPGDFGEDFVELEKCPLNVCCSKHGYCGTTEEFCGKKKVDRPSCSKDDSSFSRVVGYYESWSEGRPCNRFYPEQIPKGIYTHINFAFAGIDPDTYELVPASQSDIELYERVAALKKKDSQLKVMIAVGGWTFNDPGPTQTTFSDIARSEKAQKAFIKSVLSFMQTYDFDGLDLDWEYPQAEDRAGRDEDFENFPKFMANVKKALTDYEVSVTLPASFWYLQHFDIKKLSKYVDFFNMMTYDFHGVWDKPNKWVGPYLNSHTNLTEIKDGMDLLWRNDISPSKVTLGMAFYGRGFTATSPNCLEPGCTFESGTPAQACSGEIGVMLNSEIEDIMASENVSPVLDKEAAVQVLTYGDGYWVTYDDEDTLQLKADFARSQCLGGVMVWAISHDTDDAKYSIALAKAAPRKKFPWVDLLLADSESGYTYDEHYKEQCRWTGCDEICPNNWIRMMRKDSKARDQEFMVDNTGCDGRGSHKLCCPPDQDIPTCGWYTHHNGNCDETCPSGTKEIGSNAAYCDLKGGAQGIAGAKKYQAACCTVDTQSMELYSQCSWQDWPVCANGSCGDDDTIAESHTGSGDARCIGWYSLEDSDGFGPRKYCCDQPDENTAWSSCDWYDNLGSSTSEFPSDYCHANCPDGDVRVAMEQSECAGGSARARCCKPDYKTLTKRFSNDEDVYYDSMLDSFLDDAVCDSVSDIFDWDPFKRARALSDLSLYRRADDSSFLKWQAESATISLISVLFWGSPRPATIDVWDNQIRVSVYNSLSYENLADYIQNAGRELFMSLGSSQGPRYVACNMALLNQDVGGDGDDGGGSFITDCTCERDDCCQEDDDECIAFGEQSLRIAARSNEKTYSWFIPDPSTGETVDLSWYAPEYPIATDLKPVEDLAKLTETWFASDKCAVLRPVTKSILRNGLVQTDVAQMDHAFERNAIVSWADSAFDGLLAGKSSDRDKFMRDGEHYSLPFEFFQNTLTQVNSPAGSFQLRMMNALGSNANPDVMTLLSKELNRMKANFWLYNQPVGERINKFTKGKNKRDLQKAGGLIRDVIAAYLWHNERKPNDRLKTVVNSLREILHEAEGVHYSRYQVRVHAVEHFDAWLGSHFAAMRSSVSTFVTTYATTLLDKDHVQNNKIWRAQIKNMENKGNILEDIDTEGFFPSLDDDGNT
ncbi:putative class V chitinase [Emericellopsis atlantica]|uniref:chitinase n=1 Tax=Emericellopsis atlantica TaxID=2614577 RepID=A0A9P7ZH40_9HYPO|nr:putative class V chitinase [Emericellopsis atlantica]KAG9251358.1 putative class V chitinase [Emericellopsis atlantica]